MNATITRNGSTVAVLNVNDKTFSTGNTGFYGNGKVVIDGLRYQAQVQLVLIKGQGAPVASVPTVTHTVTPAAVPAKLTPAESLERARAQKAAIKTAKDTAAVTLATAARPAVAPTSPAVDPQQRMIDDMTARILAAVMAKLDMATK